MSDARRTRLEPIVVERREQAEEQLAREIADLVRGRARAVLGLATGDTTAGVYRELVRLRREEGLDFGRVSTFNLDEYLGLEPDHPATLARWMRERFFEPLTVSPEARHVPASNPPAAEIAEHCRDYELAIRRAGGVDLQILGVGRNGHVGFNEPGSARGSRTREVELHAWTREDAARAFGGIASVPRRAITMGVGTILEARRIRILAFGRHKAAIVARALEDPVGPEIPATFLREHPDARIWLDREAAAHLGSTRRAVPS